MTYGEKIEKFNTNNKTPYEELPIQMKFGSSTHNPDRK